MTAPCRTLRDDRAGEGLCNLRSVSARASCITAEVSKDAGTEHHAQDETDEEPPERDGAGPRNNTASVEV